jgi:conjugative transfer signal peptidase TraF
MTPGLFVDSPKHLSTIPRHIAVSCFGIVIVTFQLFNSIGLRINTSPSLPVGLYIRTSNPAASLVEFCPAEPYAQLAVVRGYRSAGNCRDGAAPLLKPVIAQARDVIDISPKGITVNGLAVPNSVPVAVDSSGRQLTPWPAGRYVVRPGEVWVVSSFNRRSFDSRYFGPVATSAIRGRVQPLITCGK